MKKLMILFSATMCLLIGPSSVFAAGCLSNGESIIADEGGSLDAYGFSLVMQQDGNLVIYNNANAPTWATNTTGNRCGAFGLGHCEYFAIMQDDGNFVVYEGAPGRVGGWGVSPNDARWATGTNGKACAPYYACINYRGKLEITGTLCGSSGNGVLLWSN